jgi:two-component system alkaline phosphatase synthesis response regulator PhoP
MEQKTILLIDDEPDFVSIVKTNLEKAGFTVDTAYGGKEGLKKIEANPPDAIVLDVMMPDLDGYQVCSELKQSQQYSKIPVLMLTAVASQIPSTRYSHYNGMSMEADDYLPKPASAEQILERLKALLKL